MVTGNKPTAMPSPEWLVIYHKGHRELALETVELALPPSDFFLESHRMIFGGGYQATHATVYRLRERKEPEFIREVVLEGENL